MARKAQTPLAGFGLRLNIARTRGSKEITHQEIATAVGVSRVAVTKWEGSANPAIKPPNLFETADFLKVRARWLAIGEGPMELELTDEATRLAEDWSTLPAEYRAAIRKHTDDLLAVTQTFPQLRHPIGDEIVGKHLKPAPKPSHPKRNVR